MEHSITSKNFCLHIKLNVFEEDFFLPVNTSMEVTAQSDEFFARAMMDIDIRGLAKFAADLSRLYKTLSGEAWIEEPYGTHMYLSFTGDGRGHIAVKGYLEKGNRAGHIQSLEFENEIDQTCLEIFSRGLYHACEPYMERQP